MTNFIAERNLMPCESFDWPVLSNFTNIYHAICGACSKGNIVSPINIQGGSCKQIYIKMIVQVRKSNISQNCFQQQRCAREEAQADMWLRGCKSTCVKFKLLPPFACLNIPHNCSFVNTSTKKKISFLVPLQGEDRPFMFI